MNHKELQCLPIVMISMSRWDGEYSSAAISLAKEFAKTNEVYYFDHPFTLKDVFLGLKKKEVRSRFNALFFGKKSIKQISDYPQKLFFVTPLVVLPINWLPKNSRLYDFLLRINNYIFFKSLRHLLKSRNIEDFIYFNSYNPFYGRKLPESIKPHSYIYQSRDDISESEYVHKHGVKLEIEALSNADLSLATGRGLIKKLSKYNHQIKHLPNAADTSIFDSSIRWKKPKQLEDITTKIIGYMGNICHRINYELLHQIAQHHSDKTVVMLGPRNDEKHNSYNFEELKNVIFVGRKHISELPAYLSYFDCAIIPFKINELTKGIYPLKINEYLSMGKPVVTTNFSEDLIDFKDYVYIANSEEDFINKIEEAINNDTNALSRARINLSKQNSWSNRVELFWKYLQESIPG